MYIDVSPFGSSGQKKERRGKLYTVDNRNCRGATTNRVSVFASCSDVIMVSSCRVVISIKLFNL